MKKNIENQLHRGKRHDQDVNKYYQYNLLKNVKCNQEDSNKNREVGCMFITDD